MVGFWVPDKWARSGWGLAGVTLPAAIRCTVIFFPPKGTRPRNILLRGPHGKLFTVTWRSFKWRL
jgi:hypothetical protein